jgi:hypothetical protein
MKKLLSLLLLAMLSVGVWAENVYYTLDGSILGGTNGYATVSEITQNNMTWMVTGNTQINPWRIGGKDLTNVDREVYSATAMGSAITKVSLALGNATATINSIKLVVASDANFNNKIDEKTASFTANTTIDFTPSTGSEWATGAYYKFIFNVTAGSSNQYVQLISATFYVEDGVLNAPQFNPVGGTFYAPVDVEITATAGATIYYTTNGNDPTTSSTVYSEPINISQTTTLKAIAAKDGVTSEVATATYTMETAQTVANIAAYAALDDDVTAAIGNPVVVTYANGQNTYVKDATGFLCIYGNDLSGKYKHGDVIPAGFGGVKTTYNNGPEMKFPFFGFQDATETQTVTPDEITVDNFSAQPMWKYVIIKDAIISSVEGKNVILTAEGTSATVTGYNQFNVAVPADHSIPYDVIGIVTSHQGNPELYLVEIVDNSPLPTVDNIAGLLALDENVNAVFNNPVTAIYQNGSNLYIKDESGYMLVYGPLNNTYNNGDVLTGIAGSWKTYGVIKEMIPLADYFTEATAGTPVEPETLAIEEIDQSLVHNFLKIENCSLTKIDDKNYTLDDETGELIMYLKFADVTAPEDLTANYDISGFLTLYKPNGQDTPIMEFYPIEIKKVGGEENPPIPGDVNGDGSVTSADVTALYNYLLNNDSSALVNPIQDGDEPVTAGDITAVYNIILGSN